MARRAALVAGHLAFFGVNRALKSPPDPAQTGVAYLPSRGSTKVVQPSVAAMSSTAVMEAKNAVHLQDSQNKQRLAQ